MTDRRRFLKNISLATAASFLPYRQLLAGSYTSDDTIITEIEILKLTGTFYKDKGLHRQHQQKASDIYPELCPPEYHDVANMGMGPTTLHHDYLVIKTKGGIEGLYGLIDSETEAPILRQLKPLLLGKDALAVEQLWDMMYRSNRHARAGHFMMAISAIDNALWDIRGRYFNVPVYQLLGGGIRKEVNAYASCLNFTVEKDKVAPRAKALMDSGFMHQKWFFAYGLASGNHGLHRNIELVEELRGALGDQAQLMFDAYMGWDLPFAIQWCKAVEKYNPYWLEEAFLPDHLESFAQLAKNTSISLATGEHFYSRWEVQNFLNEDAIRIVQADPEWCGGISELVKICNISSAAGAKVMPHGHNIHAQLHVVASQSPETCPLVEYLINHVPYKVHFQKNPPLTTNGILQLPTKPGFGIEIDDAKVEKREVLTKI